MTKEKLKEFILDVPNFPREGIVFKDITPLLESPEAFRELIDQMKQLIPQDVTKIVSIESRGFVLGAALAYSSGRGLVLCRKPGKLPRETYSATYQLEYGQDSLEIHKTALNKDDKVFIVDDVLATGGTAQATIQLCENSGAKVSGLCFLAEISFLNGRQKLDGYNATSFITY